MLATFPADAIPIVHHDGCRWRMSSRTRVEIVPVGRGAFPGYLGSRRSEDPAVPFRLCEAPDLAFAVADQSLGSDPIKDAQSEDMYLPQNVHIRQRIMKIAT